LALAHQLTADAEVTPPAPSRGRFGQNGLRVRGKVFAMLVDDALAVKLPAAEVEAAVASEAGERLVLGRRRMKEWLCVRGPMTSWKAWADRARMHVGR
jgi:hypothetical protein